MLDSVSFRIKIAHSLYPLNFAAHSLEQIVRNATEAHSDREEIYNRCDLLSHGSLSSEQTEAFQSIKTLHLILIIEWYPLIGRVTHHSMNITNKCVAAQINKIKIL